LIALCNNDFKGVSLELDVLNEVIDELGLGLDFDIQGDFICL
jgi:hypothetical protein